MPTPRPTHLHRRPKPFSPVLILVLIGLPLLGAGLHGWFKSSRVVEATELVGVWTVDPALSVGPPGLREQVEPSLTNQWLALGSRGTCWFHAPSPSSPWRGETTWAEIVEYGNTLSPVQWPGGPAIPSLVALTNEAPRRRPRNLTPPALRWSVHTNRAGGRAETLAQIVIERDGRLDGDIPVRTRRNKQGDVELSMVFNRPEGVLTLGLRRRDPLDIDAAPAGAPAPDPAPAAP